MPPWDCLTLLNRNSYRALDRNIAAVLLGDVETLLDLNLLRNLVASFFWHRATLPVGICLWDMLGYLLALLLGHGGTLLLAIPSIMANIGVHGGALVLIHCLVGGLHGGAALRVLHCGAELPVCSLVHWLAPGGIPRAALCLHLGGVRGLQLSLALPVRHRGTLGLKTGFLNNI